MNATASQARIGLAVNKLRVIYDDFVAVADTSIRVQAGESFGIVGESGSGKSTVLRAICGLAPRSAGTVELLGPPGTALPAPGSKAFRRQVQMVFQDPYGSLHPRQTVDRILAEPLAIHAITDAEARIERALDEVGLGTGFRFRYPHQLSGGQRQRIAIARVMLKDAPILLLDEATSALDSEVEAAIQSSLNTLMQGKTVIAIAHRLSTIAAMDRLIVLDQGRIIEEGDHRTLLAKGPQGGLYARLWAHQSGGFLADDGA